MKQRMRCSRIPSCHRHKLVYKTMEVSMNSISRLAPVAIALTLAACDDSQPAGPTGGLVPAPTIQASEQATPDFNLEVVLRATGSSGFGLVKFRQPKDDAFIVYLDTWVRDLAPNTAYRLQRAVDGIVDDICAGTDWITLGQGPTPHAIITDDKGTGAADLWRGVPALPGLEFDIHFRVIDGATGAVVLQSECYQYVISL